MDKLFHKIGGWGWYQTYSYLVIGFGINSTGWFFYGLPYFTQIPDYLCYDIVDPPPGYPPIDDPDLCTKENIMDGNPAIASWAIDTSSPRSLNNWTLKLDLTYISDTHIAFIGTAYFIGWAATLLWFPRFGDVYGRKKMYILGKLMDLLVFITIFFTKNINVMIAAFFIFGAFTSLRVNVGYNYLIEMAPRSHKVLMGTTWNMNEGVPYLIMTIFFWTTNYGSWIWIVGIGFCFEIWCLATVFFMPESPSWLIEKEMIDEAEQAMAMVARFNKMPFKWDR